MRYLLGPLSVLKCITLFHSFKLFISFTAITIIISGKLRSRLPTHTSDEHSL